MEAATATLAADLEEARARANKAEREAMAIGRELKRAQAAHGTRAENTILWIEH